MGSPSQGAALSGLLYLAPHHGTTAARMSWTWKGFWGDDPVYRFNSQDFFQSGRHKAEERFWVQYIHNDGSFRKPLRSRLSSAGSSYSPASSTRSSSPGYSSRQLINALTAKEMVTKNEDSVEKKGLQKEDAEDKMLEEFCSCCSKCKQPVEKYFS